MTISLHSNRFRRLKCWHTGIKWFSLNAGLRVPNQSYLCNVQLQFYAYVIASNTIQLSKLNCIYEYNIKLAHLFLKSIHNKICCLIPLMHSLFDHKKLIKRFSFQFLMILLWFTFISWSWLKISLSVTKSLLYGYRWVRSKTFYFLN